MIFKKLLINLRIFLDKEISDVYNTFAYVSFKKLGGIGDGVFDNKDVIEKAINYNATKYEVVKSFPSGFITSHHYDNDFISGNYFPVGLGATYLFVNHNLAKDFDFGQDGMDWNNKNSGYGIVVDGRFIGIISGYSAGSGCFNIRGNRSNLSIGNGSAKIIKMSGVTFLNGGGKKKIKPVFDWDNTILPYGK